jgi:6,7-dimethyl-8-ribityllumazine synthase
MDFKAAAYNAFFKRNSLWFGAIVATAVVIEGTSSSFMDSVWHNLNKGVSLLQFVGVQG